MTHRIKDVKPLADFVVSAIFQNGIEKKCDLKLFFDTHPQFKQFENNIQLFQQVKVDVGGYGIVWNDELDLDAEDIWENGIETVKKCRVNMNDMVGYQLTKARNSVEMTQKELSEKTCIYQADISKIERGMANPSIQTLQRLADGMGLQLKIEFIRK